MKSHEQYAALLDAYIDGALSEQDAARVREHLAECPECQSYVSDALVMRELFPGLEETETPEGFADSVLSALPAQKILWRKQWQKIAAPLAACIAVVLLVRGFSGLTMGGTTGASADRGGGATKSAEAFDGETVESAELYGAAFDETETAQEDAAELQTAGAASNGAVTASVTFDSGVTDTDAGVPETPLSGASYADADDADNAAPLPEPSEAEDSASYRKSSSASTSAFSMKSGAQDTADAMPPEAAPQDAADTMPSDMNASASTPPDAPRQEATGAISEETAPADEEAAVVTEAPETEYGVTEAEYVMRESDAVTVTVWTLAADAADVMERYPPDNVTERGIWYVLTSAEFDELCERFPDLEIIAGPETMDAESLPDDAPALINADAVYIFVPTP